MKVYKGNRGIYPLILNLGTGWRLEDKFTPWELYPRCPLNRRLMGHRAGLDGFVEDENLLALYIIVYKIVYNIF